jgi:hypothetical protein
LARTLEDEDEFCREASEFFGVSTEGAVSFGEEGVGR